MKHLTFFLTLMVINFSIAAQTALIEKNILKAEKQLQDGFPKEAETLLDSTLQTMRCSDNIPLFVKANILYITAISQYQEDAVKKSIRHLETTLNRCQSPATEIFHSYLGELYQQMSGNSFRKTNLENSDDLDTWTSQRIAKTSQEHYLQSLQNRQPLQNQQIEDYKIVLSEEKNRENFMPTLYDVLAYRFFQSCNGNISVSTHSEFLAPLNEFLKLDIQTDSTNSMLLAAKEFQQILKFHLNRSHQIMTVIHFDIFRLNFFDANRQHTELKIKALDYLITTFGNESAITSAYFAKAQILNELPYNAETGENRYSKIDAVKLCSEAMAKFPDTEGAKNCAELLKTIEEQSFSVETETDVPVQQPALMRVDFKNVKTLYFKVYAVSEQNVTKLVNNRSRYDENFYKEILTSSQSKLSWSVSLPEMNDKRLHSTELELPALEVGYYLIFSSLSSDFNQDSEFSVAKVQVSNLLPVLLQENSGNHTLLVVDRQTGKPLKDVQLAYYENNKNTFEPKGTAKTDENGLAILSETLSKQSLYVKLQLGEDVCWTGSMYLRNYDFVEHEQIAVQLFTDRAVYRPGQTVYYKGVVYRRNLENVRVAANFATSISVRDPNYQELFNLKVASNDFGSFNGSFVVPENMLNGNITLQSDNIFQTIRVEEYKRPRFEVNIENPKTEFALNDTVKVSGKALMLNGLPLQHASVKYSVKRTFYRPRMYWFFDVQEEEIFSGTTETQDDGTFLLSFTATPKHDNQGKYFYRFSVSAEVTDVTGEVQQSQLNIAIGNEPLHVQLSADQVMVKGVNDKIAFTVMNTQGESLPLAATLVIKKLEQPNKIYTERKWEMPEIQIIEKKTFEKKFPNYRYEKQKEESGTEVFRKEFSADETRKFDLSKLNLTSGSYRMVVSVINKSGEKVEQKTIVNLLNINDKKCTIKDNAMFNINADHVEIGDTVTLYYASGAKNANLFFALSSVDGSNEKRWMNIGGKCGAIEIPTGDHLKTDFVVKFYTFINNTPYIFSQYVTVSDPKQKLRMEISGIRDKTLPGAKETWQVKISDWEGKPVLASMFAGMYDAALDQFAKLEWNFSPKKIAKTPSLNETIFGLSTNNFNFFNKKYLQTNYSNFNPPNLNWFGFSFWNYPYFRGGKGMPQPMSMRGDINSDDLNVRMEMVEEKSVMDETDVATTGKIDENPTPNIRQNFNETAFFYPDVRTDAAGNLVLEFTMPETSTRWNMKGIAYTKSLQTVYYDTVIVTKSDFMVLPNLPRFLRSGDECRLITRISNSSESALSGIATLKLENPINGKVLNHFVTDGIEKPFEVSANQSVTVSWNVQVSDETDLLQITMSATSGAMTDGEKHIISILPNEATALETVAIELSEAGSHSFTLKNLENPDADPQHLTVELTTNPIWYAIQALPSLLEQKYNCTDYIFNALYSSVLSGYILNSNPEIKKTFDVWKNYDSDAFLSSLEQNRELKNILLNETPWVAEAQDETARKQRLATLFDVNQLNYNRKTNIEKLQQRQSENGAFVWFPEMGESFYITQYIVTGIGKLKAMNLMDGDLEVMAEKAVGYLDRKMKERKANHPETVKSQLDYLLARSYFLNVEMDETVTEIFNEICDYSVKNHTKLGFNHRAKLALALQRVGKEQEAKKIALSLDNYGLGNKKTGKYWRTQQGSAFASDISLSALMAEVYQNVLKDEHSLLEVQKYLIRNKRTNEWMNATATADAVYALLLGEQRLEQHNPVMVKIGNITLHSETEKTQAGSGYFKRSFAKSDITAEMKNIVVETTNDNLLFGGIYLQYQIPVEKMAKSMAEDLTVDKKLFVAKIENGTTVYVPFDEHTTLQVGDKVVVRLTITSNRDMEYVHLNDMRSGSFEPVESVSGYVWRSDLGYYRDVKDASVNLFFEKIPRGTFVIEYELWATQNGTFANGFSTIQCLYAPEFSGNSDGEQVRVE